MYNASVYNASVYNASVYDASVCDASLYNAFVYDVTGYLGHTAVVPEGREGMKRRGPQLEIEARRAPKTSRDPA